MALPQAYYRDGERFQLIVVATGSRGIRVTEKRGDWCDPFWMPEDEFDSLVSDNDVERVGKLTTEQFDKILGRRRNA